jgi:hypothetical protein
MRCFFTRHGHIVAVEELFGLSDKEAEEKSHQLFLERNGHFDGFELWDRARFILVHPKPIEPKPLG